ncbi:MAG: transposase [Candidatus Omnitrophota bacterium]
MPRKPRYFEQGYVYHAVQRGNNKADIFFDEEDYRIFLKLMCESKKMYPCLIYAYCLMRNHLHLLIEAIKQNSISLFMKYLTGNYVLYINRKYNRTGTLFGSRFKAGLVQTEKYFANCMRYIDRNPVRAKLVQTPAQYPWSSYNFHTSPGSSLILNHHSLYLEMGKNIDDCRLQYKKFVLDQVEDETILQLIRARTNKSGVIGTDAYIKALTSKTKVDMLCRSVGRQKKGSDTINLSTELSTFNCV